MTRQCRRILVLLSLCSLESPNRLILHMAGDCTTSGKIPHRSTIYLRPIHTFDLNELKEPLFHQYPIESLSTPYLSSSWQTLNPLSYTHDCVTTRWQV